MKFKNIFHLIEDAQEVCSLFERVETPEQMVSTLERIKKQFSQELLDLVQSLRLSTEAILEDALEVGGAVGGEPEDADFDFGGDGDLVEKIEEDTNVSDGKNQTSEVPATQEK